MTELATRPSRELLSRQLGAALVARKLTIATAESCTGGLLAGAITDTAGSSAWFEQGFVTYANRAKTRWLGVPEAELVRYGAVSEPVVRAMALGALQYAGMAIATSGIAGPDGGSPQKPVGTVWFAWALGRHCETACLCLPGSRQEVREAAVEYALVRALEILKITV
jgi:nicotinamide-nucleotide amidase